MDSIQPQVIKIYIKKELITKTMNKVFIDILPINTTGRYKNKINWVNSVGQIIHFIYEDIEGDLKIIEYIA